MINPFYLWQKLLSKVRLRKGEKISNEKIKNDHSVILYEGDFIARTLKKDEMKRAYRFRYKIFCEELRWLPLNESKEEFDEYDQFSIHFGIFSKNGELLGYSRVIPPNINFMLEKEFKDLINNHAIRKEKDTVEISRTAIDKTFRRQGFNLINLLFKLMYKWSIKNGIKYWYMAIESNYLKSLQNLFPCKQIGRIKFYQPNTATTAALLDLKEAEDFLLKVNPKLYEWFIK